MGLWAVFLVLLHQFERKALRWVELALNLGILFELREPGGNRGSPWRASSSRGTATTSCGSGTWSGSGRALEYFKFAGKSAQM